MSGGRRQKTEYRRQNWLAGLIVVSAVLTLAGCSSIQRDPPLQVWPDMKFQPKFRAQLSTDLFPDHRQSRAAPGGAIARGHMQEDTPFYTGMEGKLYVGKMPVPVTDELLTEGQWRFNTYCSPCHDRTGLGHGMVPTRWPAWQPQNLMEDRIVQMADGDIFNVITYGRRTMPPYFVQNRPEERWAIIAYVRVLQRAAHGNMSDVPAEERASLEYKGPPPAPPPAPGQAPTPSTSPATTPAAPQGNPKP
jgi:mono/diheme cytochrome c family protein